MMNKRPTITTLVWFALLSMLGFLATDMYLPAFDTLRTYFDTSANQVGLTLTIFVSGLAGGQLLYGPLSDRYGRNITLSVGLIIFTIGSLLCSFASSIEFLIAARFLQALGACSASVLWQAIVLDRYDSETTEKVFATIMPLLALSPALAPLLGAAVETQFNWQAIFLFSALLGGVLLVFTRLEAKNDVEQEKSPICLKKIGASYQEMLSSKKFIGYVMIFGGCAGAFFAYLTAAPLLMAEMGYSGSDIGLSFVPQTIAFIVGGYGCRFLLNRFSGNQLLPWGLKLFVLSIVIMLVVSLRLELTSFWPILAPFCLLAVANGAVYPIVINAGLKPFKHISATAAGLMNFLQMSICFICSGLVSALISHGIIAMTGVMTVCAVMVFVGYILCYERPHLQTDSKQPQVA
uniref:purine nucleoside transporter PunC n=1 Tax=Thaumasiovibrio occultus TaxID=1891184 RepID=UPI00192CE7FE|nr:purine nucleoside transporter PunC [Thaumasiovibrio occultus]